MSELRLLSGTVSKSELNIACIPSQDIQKCLLMHLQLFVFSKYHSQILWLEILIEGKKS